MADRATEARAAAIEAFAADLRALRDTAGTPSFREMSGRSRAISHTTLHEAAQGNRLPSWSTTVEFVKACGADPAAFRNRWERADATLRPGPTEVPAAVPPRATPPPAAAPLPVALPEPEPEPVPVAVSAPGPEPVAPRRRTLARAAVAVGAAAAIAVAVTLATASDGEGADPVATPTPTALTAADCPVRQTNPPSAPPAAAGDGGVFIADITLPDCDHVARGGTAVKVWRFKNVGTVPWVDYSLHRVDQPEGRDQCQTIPDVPIADTAPGATVDVSTTVTAPPQPGFCFVRFKFVDADGRIAFPGSRPVNFQLVVD